MLNYRFELVTLLPLHTVSSAFVYLPNLQHSRRIIHSAIQSPSSQRQCYSISTHSTRIYILNKYVRHTRRCRRCVNVKYIILSAAGNNLATVQLPHLGLAKQCKHNPKIGISRQDKRREKSSKKTESTKKKRDHTTYTSLSPLLLSIVKNSTEINAKHHEEK
ncbi:hypothetical protein J3E69DRAFT_133372 [Trichoderma sp. SZMC 28015]